MLAKMRDDARKLSADKFKEEDHHKRRQIPSPIPGIVFEFESVAVLHGLWVVSIDAERKHLCGLVYRSVFTNILIGPNGAESDDQFGSRIELSGRRTTRRNWCRDAD